MSIQWDYTAISTTAIKFEKISPFFTDMIKLYSHNNF